MISYLLNDSGIFHVRFVDTITASEITKFINDFRLLEGLPSSLLTLYDLREGNLEIGVKDVIELSKLAKEYTAIYKTVRTAFIVTKPRLTAYSIIFTRETDGGRISRKVFSTEEAALKWLKGWS